MGAPEGRCAEFGDRETFGFCGSFDSCLSEVEFFEGFGDFFNFLADLFLSFGDNVATTSDVVVATPRKTTRNARIGTIGNSEEHDLLGSK